MIIATENTRMFEEVLRDKKKARIKEIIAVVYKVKKGHY